MASIMTIIYSVVIYGVLMLILPYAIRLFVTEDIEVVYGYAKTYQYLLKKLGILSHMVSGYSYNPVTGAGEAHAWNLVRINGEYYYTDVTWADQTNVFYSYLNCDYSQISKDHQFNNLGYNIPQPSAAHSYLLQIPSAIFVT